MAEEVVVEGLGLGDVPDGAAVLDEVAFMAVDGGFADTEFAGNLGCSESTGKGFQDIELACRGKFYDLLAACAFLLIQVILLLLLGGFERRIAIRDIGSERDEGSADQLDAGFRWDMHMGAIANLGDRRFGGMDMPDVIMPIEVEGGYRYGKQGHQAAATADREMDMISLMFEADDQLMDRFQGGVGMAIIHNIIGITPFLEGQRREICYTSNRRVQWVNLNHITQKNLSSRLYNSSKRVEKPKHKYLET
ncbi:hypothetical protein KDW_39500 [Dictyobacter vulcani]|uniref:Uncharacterized protein n=1 Tax=Dictyobacter vulcani TaxID=2607529 RepID=A0A5J4KJ94_9CHLR|nr:hypothetical protein KDW_39500 [Dictyobacter vulcani]